MTTKYIPKYIMGNWKMHGLQADAAQLAAELAKERIGHTTEVALFPPLTSLAAVKEKLQGTGLKLGAQDCSAEDEGAFTGDISAAMLKDAGCRYVILGHSERRSLHQESNALIKRKAEAAIKGGLVPVICVGESMAEREAGNYLDIITIQIKESLPTLEHSNACLIAYEPVWAIGSGKTPAAEEITEVHKTIASLLSYATSGAEAAILYGGSVKAASACAILATEGVSGVLVGGASLNAGEFGAIIRAANG